MDEVHPGLFCDLLEEDWSRFGLVQSAGGSKGRITILRWWLIAARQEQQTQPPTTSKQQCRLKPSSSVSPAGKLEPTHVGGWRVFHSDSTSQECLNHFVDFFRLLSVPSGRMAPLRIVPMHTFVRVFWPVPSK
jgi:hypothetical protein